MKELTRLEEIYLLAILRLEDNAYGVEIRKLISKQTGKRITYGQLYYTLEQIFAKGYVNKRAGDPTPVRGGCRKIYYSLTNQGRNALVTTHEIQKTIWEGLSVSSIKKG